jgi:hypothetical protein
LLADVVAIDGEIIEVLPERERRKRRCRSRWPTAQLSAITAAAALLPPAARDNFLRV